MSISRIFARIFRRKRRAAERGAPDGKRSRRKAEPGAGLGHLLPESGSEPFAPPGVAPDPDASSPQIAPPGPSDPVEPWYRQSGPIFAESFSDRPPPTPQAEAGVASEPAADQPPQADTPASNGDDDFARDFAPAAEDPGDTPQPSPTPDDEPASEPASGAAAPSLSGLPPSVPIIQRIEPAPPEQAEPAAPEPEALDDAEATDDDLTDNDDDEPDATDDDLADNDGDEPAALDDDLADNDGDEPEALDDDRPEADHEPDLADDAEGETPETAEVPAELADGGADEPEDAASEATDVPAESDSAVGEQIEPAPAAEAAAADPPTIVPIRGYYVARTHDTLRSVAAQFLNAPERWSELQQLNAAYPGIADAGPDTLLPQGAALALPGDPLPWGRPDPVYLWTLAETFLFTAWGREPSPEEVVPFWRGLSAGALPEGEQAAALGTELPGIESVTPPSAPTDEQPMAPPPAFAMPPVVPGTTTDDEAAPPEPDIDDEPDAEIDDEIADTAAEPDTDEPDIEPPLDVIDEPEPDTDELVDLYEPQLDEPEPALDEPDTDEPDIDEPADLYEPQLDEPVIDEPEPAFDEPDAIEPDFDQLADLYEPELDEPEPELDEPDSDEPTDLYEPQLDEPVDDEPEPALHEPEIDEPEPELDEPDTDEPDVDELAELYEPEIDEPEPELDELDTDEPDVDELAELYEPVIDELEPVLDEPEIDEPELAEAVPFDEATAPEDVAPPALPEDGIAPPPMFDEWAASGGAPEDGAAPYAGFAELDPFDAAYQPAEAEAPRAPQFLPSITGSAPAAQDSRRRVRPMGRTMAGTAVGDAMMLWQLARRRRQGQAADAGAVELTLQQTANSESLVLIEAAMRHLWAVTVGRGQPRPDVLAVRVGTYGFEVLLERPAPTPPGWRAASEGYVLELPQGVTAHDLGAVGPGPSLCPALVPVGNTFEGPLLLNLQQIGALAISGPSGPVTSLIAAIVATLASSPMAGDLDITAIGLDAAASSVGWERVRLAQFDSAELNELLEAKSAGDSFADDRHDIVFFGPGHDLLIQRAQLAATAPYSRLTVVGATSAVGTRWPWSIHVDGTGTAVVQPVAITMTAAQAPSPEVFADANGGPQAAFDPLGPR